jgi:hypothetical protein
VTKKKKFQNTQLILDPESDSSKVGNDTTLGWSIKGIHGRFVRGILEGIIFCELQDGRRLVAEVHKGVFHGPLMLHAIIQILPVKKFSFHKL